jgi:hypothetical protein
MVMRFKPTNKSLSSRRNKRPTLHFAYRTNTVHLAPSKSAAAPSRLYSLTARLVRSSPQAGLLRCAVLRPDGDRAAFGDGGRGQDEGRPGKISTGCAASNKGHGVETSNGLVPFTRNESGGLIEGLAGD